jgi:hypothetical protein
MNWGSFWIGVGLSAIAHIITWFQLNGQFINNWFKDNTFILSLFGIPISYAYIYSTRYMVDGLNGLYWPSRFMGFSIGTIIFGLFTYLILGETINLKTAISLLLAVVLAGIQVFWK